MNKIIRSFILVISMQAFAQNEALIEKIHQSDDVYDVEKNYEFTRKNIDDFKDFLNLSISILTEKQELAEVMSHLDSRFRGGLDAPKKFWKPITTGSITFTYFFREPTKTQRGLYGYYGSFFKKRNESKVWNVNRISLLPGNVISSRFEKNDFVDLKLTFKERILVKDLPKNEWNNYSSTQYENLDDINTLIKIERGCYAIYRYERVEDKERLQLDFCERKEDFQETHQNPNKFERIFIRRIFADEPDKHHWLKRIFGTSS